MNFTYKQPYVTWKGPSTGSAVPTWSRPLINNNANTNTGTSFAARPIKHWRKQLIPAANTGISKNAGVGMPMDRPGGSVYLGSTVDCSNCLVNITEMTPTTKNIMFDNTNDSSGNCIACNPETNIIKSGITLLNKKYYTDTKSYLQSRCQTYDQKLSTIPIPGNSYINPTTHQPIPSSDFPTGSQVYYTENCSKKCAAVNSVVRTIYKPNNQQYSQQGSVSSSSRLTRLKNNTITKNGNSFKTALGQQGANAGRYQGTSESTYFLKTKNQECVPYHRDGNKTTNCNVTLNYNNKTISCVKNEECTSDITDINITDIATLGTDGYTLNANTTINICERLIVGDIIFFVQLGKQLINKGIINIIGTTGLLGCGGGGTIINQGVININLTNTNDSGVINNNIFNNTGVINIFTNNNFQNSPIGTFNNSCGTINNSGIINNYNIFYNPQNQSDCANGLITGTGTISEFSKPLLTSCAP